MTEFWFDAHTLVIGEIEERDDSFDHEFGVEKRTAFEFKSFSVVAYIGPFDYDITDAKRIQADLQIFKDYFLMRLNSREAS